MQPSSSHQEPPSPAVITPSEDHLDLDPLDSNTSITDFTNPDFPFHPSSDREATMDDPHPTITPPPHLAARLYRNRINSARRKSSATSSRRNSMSSVHSHGSSLSHHRRASATPSGCHQSNYIAQHLRRASIIESRKARLADRAAHVEQVRLRGALYKAAPRGSATNSEEKALAAQLAKEKYLAKVAAACAEEVARAKRVAEEVKERKLAEEARARLEMEERHAEAEKRRAEYQRNLQARRARRADSAEKKLAVLDEVVDVDEEGGEAAVVVDGGQAKDSAALSEEEAAGKILRRWRRFRRGAPVRAFNAIDLPERVRTMSFDEMTALVADAATIAATTAILMHLGLQDADDENAALNSRTFLSAFMIFAHPVAVLNNQNGAQEQDLIGKASDLIGHFDAVIQRLAPWNNYSPSSTQLETLSQAYSAYTSAFAAWRLQDSSVIIEGMVAAFVELDAIWQTVKDDSRGEVASDYRDGIRDNQVMLLSRIRKLAGPDRADQLIKKAIRESRRRRPRKRPAAEVRPRGVEAASQQQPAAAVASSSSTTSTSETAAEAAINSVVAPPPALSANLQSSDVSRLFTPMLSNRALTHELAIDKEYRLEDDATTSELRSKLYRSICDSMKRGFEAGEGSRWTVSAAENVREKLLRMLKPGSAMHNLISETLDLEDVARQSRLGVFSYAGFFAFMASVLPKLCAPFRDAKVKALAEHLQDNNDGNGTATQDLDGMIEKLFKLLRVVDLLSLDYTNFMIMSAAPTLIREAPGYEQRLFARSLETNEISLSKTSRWWTAAQAQLTAETDRRDPEGVRRAEDKPSSEKIYATALVNLALEEPGELREEKVPETLMLDLERLREVRARAVRVAVVGAVLLTAKNLLRRDSRAQWKNEGMRLFALLAAEGFAGESTTAAAVTSGAASDGSNGGDAEMQAATIATTTTTAQKAFAILETAHNMPPATKTQLSAMISRFFSQAAAATAPTSPSSSPSTSSDPAAAATAPKFTDPVLKVLYARLRSHILSRLSASTAAEKVRAASGASEALAKVGLPEFVGVVGGVVETLERVRRVDWEGHGVWLERVAGEARA